MSKKRKKKMPLWQKLIIIGVCVFLGVITLFGLASKFRAAALKNNLTSNSGYVTILFVDSDDTYISSQVLTESDIMKVETSPERTGYTFIGWSDGKDIYSANDLFNNYDPVKNTTFKASYTANKYNLTFHLQDNTTQEKEVTFDAPIGELPPVTDRDGYTECWIDEYDNIYTESTLINVAEDIDLYPYYKPYEFNLIFNCAESEEDIEQRIVRVHTGSLYYYGDSFVSPTMHDSLSLRKTHNVTWFIDGNQLTEGDINFIDLTKYTDGDDVDIYGTWTPKTFEITFVTNVEGYENIIVQQEYNKEIQFPTLTNGDLTLAYWEYEIIESYDPLRNYFYKCYPGETYIYNNTEVTTYTAIWVEGVVIRLDYNGAEVGIGEELVIVPIGSTEYTDLAFPGREGYSFAGWLDKSTGTLYEASCLRFLTEPESKEMNLIAQWSTEPTFTLRFDYNGADGGDNIENLQIFRGWYYGDLPEPTKTGYKFLGWGNGSTVSDYSGRCLTFLTSGGVVAMWEKI